jgi:hypothetical protein
VPGPRDDSGSTDRILDVKRPRLSTDSFLKHVFSPSKNPLPTGLRKTTLSGLKGGRKKTRLASFNRMPAKNQAILDRAGMREAYLRGDATLGDAKGILRQEAIGKGLAKPVRQRRKNTPLYDTSGKGAGWQVFHHLNNLNTSEKKDPRTIAAFVNLMDERQRRRAMSFTSFTDVLAAATQKRNGTIDIMGKFHDPEDVAYIDGEAYNVFWYHSGGQ